MPVTDTQLDLIFRYFDGDLSAEEEERLMRQLQQNVELQQAFDQQILMQQFEPGEGIESVVSTATESADDFLKRVTGSRGAEQVPAMVRPMPIVKKSKAWMAAAAVVICLLAGVLYYQFKDKKMGDPVVKIPVRDSIAQIKQPAQSQKDSLPALAEVNLSQLYEDNYKLFSSDKLQEYIPIPATPYQNEYDQQQYSDLANRSEEVIGLKGGSDGDEEEKVANYFNFYKALANIQIQNTVKAEKLLTKLLQGSARKTELKDHLKWYLLMVYLKNNKKGDALQMANELIKNTKNIYYNKAVVIREKLAAAIVPQ